MARISKFQLPKPKLHSQSNQSNSDLINVYNVGLVLAYSVNQMRHSTKWTSLKVQGTIVDCSQSFFRLKTKKYICQERANLIMIHFCTLKIPSVRVKAKTILWLLKSFSKFFRGKLFQRTLRRCICIRISFIFFMYAKACFQSRFHVREK